MELINECSLRFAEDKDFRLLVCYPHNLLHYRFLMSARSLTALWPSSEWIILVVENLVNDSRKYDWQYFIESIYRSSDPLQLAQVYNNYE